MSTRRAAKPRGRTLPAIFTRFRDFYGDLGVTVFTPGAYRKSLRVVGQLNPRKAPKQDRVPAMTHHSHVTPCGLPGIGTVPVGMHSCHFYKDRQHLIEALVPYTLAGLQAQERCLLIASHPLPARDLIAELRAAWDGVDDALQSGALRVLDFDRWYLSASGLKSEDLVQIWLSEEEQALAAGYSGLRISGNISFLKPEDWPKFMAYERSVTGAFAHRRIIALCSYVLEDCTEDQKAQVLRAHACAFERGDYDWQLVSSGMSI